jgi:hypothetical protein
MLFTRITFHQTYPYISVLYYAKHMARESHPPMLAAAQQLQPSRRSQNPTARDHHYETVRIGMAGVLPELGVAA